MQGVIKQMIEHIHPIKIRQIQCRLHRQAGRAIARWCGVVLVVGLIVLGGWGGGAIACPESMGHSMPMRNAMQDSMPMGDSVPRQDSIATPHQENCNHAHSRAQATAPDRPSKAEPSPLPPVSEAPEATDPGATSGTTDSGTTDPGATSGTTDSGTTDPRATSGTTDPGATSGTTDPGATSGTTDSGTTDSGTTDFGITDSGTPDSGTTDAVDVPQSSPVKTYSLSLLPDSSRQQITIDPPATRLKVTIVLGESGVRCGDRLDSYRVAPGKPLTLTREADTAVTEFWAQNSGNGNARLRIDILE